MSLEIDQNAPLCDEDINISVEIPGEDIKVLVLDQHQLIYSENIPIYDVYPDETEQIPTLASVDLKSSQQMYENSESNLGEQQHCIEINHPESVEDIDQIYV